MTPQRLTSQKQIILEYLQSVKSHPFAETIYQEVKKKLPRISLGTIYRNLEEFTKQGIVLEIPGEKKRFDADTSLHHHFVCEKCRRIFDIFDPIIEIDFKNIKIEVVNQIKNYQIYLYGECQDCRI